MAIIVKLNTLRFGDVLGNCLIRFKVFPLGFLYFRSVFYWLGFENRQIIGCHFEASTVRMIFHLYYKNTVNVQVEIKNARWNLNENCVRTQTIKKVPLECLKSTLPYSKRPRDHGRSTSRSLCHRSTATQCASAREKRSQSCRRHCRRSSSIASGAAPVSRSSPQRVLTVTSSQRSSPVKQLAKALSEMLRKTTLNLRTPRRKR